MTGERAGDYQIETVKRDYPMVVLVLPDGKRLEFDTFQARELVRRLNQAITKIEL